MKLFYCPNYIITLFMILILLIIREWNCSSPESNARVRKQRNEADTQVFAKHATESRS